MKFTVVAVFVAFCLAFGVVSVSAGHRAPIISGDTIALRSAYTSGSYSTRWLECTKASCTLTDCQSTATNSKEWPSCSKQMMFIISGKKEGKPIISGDSVSLSSVNGPSFRLYCGNSTSSLCSMKTTTRSMKGGDWLEYSYATFQIFSSDADDGTPVENGDVVGLKYPYSSNSAWLTYSGHHFYPRSCSSESKKACAAENELTGFVILKKL